METSEKLKQLTKEKYSSIAGQSKDENVASCCGATSCCGEGDLYSIMADDYAHLPGYNADADLGLGCGLPTEYARIREGDTVVDLGSGAGNDAFIARNVVGATGKVIGIDFTPAMIDKARANAAKLGYANIEFRQGDIDDMPLVSNTADVVVSNCVLNLVPNKHKVFSEIYRVLKPGGHFSISDIVLEGALPDKWKQVAELYAGCIAGAIENQLYMAIIAEAGFSNVVLQKEKDITIPDEILRNYLDEHEITAYKTGTGKIRSITVYAEKPAKDDRNCCEPGNQCC